MDNIIEVQFNEMLQRTRSIWQYDYGQVLKILSGGVVLPNFLEVHFSLSRNNKECVTRIGTTVNGVTEVQIPNELLNTENKTHDYFIYAFIYVSTEKYGNTKCEIIIPVKSRIKPENPSEEPLPEPNIFHETVEAVNVAADRAKMAEQSAKESAAEAGKYAASASESAVTAEKTKEDALRKVGEKKQEAIEAIQNQEETSVGKITTHTDDEIQRIQNQVAESKGELEQTIINAGVSKEGLDESIQTASDTKTALDKSVELAGTAKTELDTSIREAGTAKTALDESTETAGTVQETLSATVKQAGVLDTSLGENIETGTQLKTDLTASGEKAVQDIQAAGSEQLGKMQAVAEEFTADREQIATNKEDIGSLKEDLNNAIQSDILHNNNLWGLSDWSQTTSGVTISYDSETGIFTFNGTAIENTDKFVFNAAQISPLLEAGTYKLWCKTISGSSTGKNPAMNFGTGLATLPINYNSNKNLATSLTLTGTQNRYKISVIGGAVFDNLKLHIWVTSVDITNETDLGFQKYGETYKTHPVLNPNISIQRLDSHIKNPSIHLSVDEKTYVTKAVSDKRNEDLFTSEIADTIEKTFVHQKNKNLCFAYISDTHTYTSNTDSVGQYKMQMNHISKVNDVVSYDFLVHCGDFVNTQWLWNNSMIQDDEYQKYIRECVMELNTTGISNVFPVIGNHDSGFIPSTDPKTHGTEYSGYLANARTMGKILNNRSVVTKDVLKPYYYVDFEIYKIRCVYISTNCDSLTTDAKGIPYEETVWFKNVLETTPDDFNILLFGHIPFSRFTMGETTSSFLNLVNGFNTHTIVDNAGTSMDADFTGRTSKILVYICGHYHGDSVVMPDNEYSVMNCPEITIGSGGYLSSGVITSGNRYDDLDAPSRELGTITQDLWDSCVLDLEKYILYLTRFGAGNDRIVNLN